MKYVIVVGDGMADHPMPELDGKTPLEAAHTPHMDALAQRGTLGLVNTIPKGFSPGSDVGNMSILGYDPRCYYTGRAPLEAASIGVELGPDDVALRCNLVTLTQKNHQWVMEDYSAGHIPTEEAKKLIELLRDELEDETFQFYAGVSYRHLVIWRGGKSDLKLTPPHDIPQRPIEPYLPQGEGSDLLRSLMERAREKLAGQRANAIWLWGAGRKPHMPTLQERYNLRGSIISAVDLIRGLGIYAGLKVLRVPGATGYLDTNYQGKVEAALRAVEEDDLVYVHVEAPDEVSHEGDLQKKIQAIEDFDAHIVGPLVEGLEQFEKFALLVLPDHPTPVSLRVHTAEPVPFVIYRSGDALPRKAARGFSEASARASRLYLDNGYEIFTMLLS
ncbi:MAG: cofactor-independent phosphoglycerate mutase [Candidatus Bipolaricaulia bacterium]